MGGNALQGLERPFKASGGCNSRERKPIGANPSQDIEDTVQTRHNRMPAE
jgi:hypothetical protein